MEIRFVLMFEHTQRATHLLGLVGRELDPQDRSDDLAVLDDLADAALHHIDRNGKSYAAVGSTGAVNSRVDACTTPTHLRQ